VRCSSGISAPGERDRSKLSPSIKNKVCRTKGGMSVASAALQHDATLAVALTSSTRVAQRLVRMD